MTPFYVACRITTNNCIEAPYGLGFIVFSVSHKVITLSQCRKPNFAIKSRENYKISRVSLMGPKKLTKGGGSRTPKWKLVKLARCNPPQSYNLHTFYILLDNLRKNIKYLDLSSNECCLCIGFKKQKVHLNKSMSISGRIYNITVHLWPQLFYIAVIIIWK